MPNNVNLTEIPADLFASSGLTEITLYDGVKTIGEKAFAECRSLASAVLPETLETIERSAFTYSGLTEITIPEGV